MLYPPCLGLLSQQKFYRYRRERTEPCRKYLQWPPKPIPTYSRESKTEMCAIRFSNPKIRDQILRKILYPARWQMKQVDQWILLEKTRTTISPFPPGRSAPSNHLPSPAPSSRNEISTLTTQKPIKSSSTSIDHKQLLTHPFPALRGWGLSCENFLCVDEALGAKPTRKSAYLPNGVQNYERCILEEGWGGNAWIAC